MPIRWHEDDPKLLKRAIEFTAVRTDFLPALIEKDYFASVLLEYLGERHGELTFKGGTSFSKVHARFFRLSEDLDFTIHTPLDASRAARRRDSDRLKAAVAKLPLALPAFTIIEPIRGANESTQYNATVGYRSLVAAPEPLISIEVGLREPLMTSPVHGMAQTLVQDPVTGASLVPPVQIRSLSLIEAVAEKIRAALCRREVAIRDFFDIDRLARTNLLDPADPALLALVGRKVMIPGTGAVDVSSSRLGVLPAQVEGSLRPVLSAKVIAEFDLERAVDIVRHIARELTQATWK